MPIFHCSHRLLKELHVDPSGDMPDETGDSQLGDWYVQMLRFGRHKGYVFTNERTLYSFVIVRSGINAKTIVPAFKDMLALCLGFEGIEPHIVKSILDDYESMRIAGGNNRSVLGVINQLKFYYDYAIDGPIPEGSCRHLSIIQKYNRIPWRSIAWKYSIDLVREILGLPPIPKGLRLI